MGKGDGSPVGPLHELFSGQNLRTSKCSQPGSSSDGKRLRGTLPVTLKSATSAARHLLVMELVEGEDLGQRLVAGPLPLEESLSYAKQIAEALGLPKI